MGELLVGVILVVLLVRVLSGSTVELDDLRGVPQLAAICAFIVLIGCMVFAHSHVNAPGGGVALRYPALGMLGIGASGVMLVLFPERMPDTERGGTLMTAFWSIFGWLLLVLAFAVVLFL